MGSADTPRPLRILVLVAIVASVLWFAATAKAETAQEAQCMAESNLAFTWTFERDEGLPLAAALDRVRQVEGLTRAQRDAAAANLRTIYDNPGIPPWVIGRVAYEACMGA